MESGFVNTTKIKNESYKYISMQQVKSVTGYQNTLAFAQEQDSTDPLKNYRDQFYIPLLHGKKTIYFTGNALGLQPKATQDHVLNELEEWATFGIEGFFHARKPWLTYHEQFAAPVAKIVGALPQEVAVMNQLTVNLHLLMVSFYRPAKTRYKILCEAKAFSADREVLVSQLKLHGHDPADALVEVEPRQGQHCIQTEDIIAAIEKNKDSLALVLMEGINYFSGQVLDMQAITMAGHKAGAVVGFDLAQAAGNIKLQLHEWDVDFAAWCSYKYLNSGPGGISGIFVNQRHLNDLQMPRFQGCRSNNMATRFKMEQQPGFPANATAWQLGTIPVLSLAAHKASVDLFEQAGMDALVAKSEKLTAYLEFVLEEINQSFSQQLEIITPRNHRQRGCQLSVIAHGQDKQLFNDLLKAGVMVDWQAPNIMRCAPVPFYNSFEDVYTFGEILKNSL